MLVHITHTKFLIAVAFTYDFRAFLYDYLLAHLNNDCNVVGEQNGII